MAIIALISMNVATLVLEKMMNHMPAGDALTLMDHIIAIYAISDLSINAWAINVFQRKCVGTISNLASLLDYRWTAFPLIIPSFVNVRPDFLAMSPCAIVNWSPFQTLCTLYLLLIMSGTSLKRDVGLKGVHWRFLKKHPDGNR